MSDCRQAKCGAYMELSVLSSWLPAATLLWSQLVSRCVLLACIITQVSSCVLLDPRLAAERAHSQPAASVGFPHQPFTGRCLGRVASMLRVHAYSSRHLPVRS
jgi:hypothetical protein